MRNALVDAFLDVHPRAQIISLGAGFDSLPFILLARARGCHIHYVEVDLEEVVRDKKGAVLRNEVVRALFEKVEESESGAEGFVEGGGRYSLQVCDFREKDCLRKVFDGAGLEKQCPTLVIAEIVLVYLEWEIADQVIKECAQWLRGVKTFLDMEHIGPHDAFGKEMVRNIAARGSPLVGIERYPSIEAQIERFHDLGWPWVQGITLLDAFNGCVGSKQRLEMNAMELLDEVEEWELIMSHYCVVLAAYGDGGDSMLQRIIRRALPLLKT